MPPHTLPRQIGNIGPLLWSLALTLVFAVVEAIGGALSGSLALLADAGHMATDSLALGFGALAAWLSRSPPTTRHSYGLQRFELLGGLVNSLFMLGIAGWLAYAAVQRFADPQPVAGGMVMIIAAVGLSVNLLVLRVLHGGAKSFNSRGAILHVLGDLLGSAAALSSGAVVYFTGWTTIDPLLSLVIGLLILGSTSKLLFEVLHVFLEGVPPHVNLAEVGRALAALQGVEEVHDLHIWTLASGSHALSAHIYIRDMQRWPQLLATIQELLKREYEITHTTIQPEPAADITFKPLSDVVRELKTSRRGQHRSR
ncbi:MAG: cation diffusion facilitator family transporter [Nitrococcus sp.]|nr:cation diffusion facilitator family transporter [Nitrococcus sp.]